MTIELLYDLLSDIQERNEIFQTQIDARVDKLSAENKTATDYLHLSLGTLVDRVDTLESRFEVLASLR